MLLSLSPTLYNIHLTTDNINAVANLACGRSDVYGNDTNKSIGYRAIFMRHSTCAFMITQMITSANVLNRKL